MFTPKRYSLTCLAALVTLIAGDDASAQSTYFPTSDDTWQRVAPASVGWDAEALSAALDVAGGRSSSGVLILHRGRILAERYWELDSPSARYSNFVQGEDPDGNAIEDVASAQKSVVAFLLGIAQERGLLRLDDSVSEHLGSGWSQASAEQEQAITIRHLMSMNSGLATDMSYAAEAGSTWLYNTPAYHNLMHVIEAVTGRDRNAVTRDWLTAKLGMEHSSWTRRRNADPAIGWGFSTTARDLARFGLMVQAGGRWGDQIVIGDTEYLRDMLSSSQSLNPAYGYLWWLNGQEDRVGVGPRAARADGPLIPSAPSDLVSMMGALDRKLYSVPSLDLVITRLGDAGGVDRVSFNEAFWQALMKAKPAQPQRQARPRFRQWQGVPRVPLPAEPLALHTAEQPNILVTVVARGLDHPWSLTFLPGGDMLVTERDGQLRVIRGGVLDPVPVTGVPAVYTEAQLSGLMEVALHPQFEENRQIYLTYSVAGEDGTLALARAHFDGKALTDLHEVFVVESPGHTAAARLAFAPDGMLFMTVGGAFNSTTSGRRAQNPDDHRGKVLRLRDDGRAPEDNPFFGKAGHKPEVYSLGHRNPMGLTVHPETGAVWAHEHSTQGGDEVNIILPGRNYGWPVVSYGRQYSGARVSERPWQEEMEQPVVVWLPSVAPSGMVFYTGDRFPAWKGNLFVGSLMTGRIGRTGHLERIVFNAEGEEIRRESMLTELKQRIRDVRQGPDGLLYVLTEDGHRPDLEGGLPDGAALLRIEPVR